MIARLDGDAIGLWMRRVTLLDWTGLLAALNQPLADAVQADRTRVAINGALLADKTALQAQAGDEVALLPPVSGG